ncbi:MAG: hypothetical protein HUK07_06455, partial [Bacteroidaceae bacterium]|nr:hypothetical protein [Bacteroidaceae bacterium]
VISVNATAQQIYTHAQSYCLNKARTSDKPIANKVPETYTIRYTDFWTHGVYANVVGQNKDVAEKCNITISAQDGKMYIHIETPNIVYPRVNEQTQYKVFMAMLKEDGKAKFLETRKGYYSEFLSPIKDFIEKRVNFEK